MSGLEEHLGLAGKFLGGTTDELLNRAVMDWYSQQQPDRQCPEDELYDGAGFVTVIRSGIIELATRRLIRSPGTRREHGSDGVYRIERVLTGAHDSITFTHRRVYSATGGLLGESWPEFSDNSVDRYTRCSWKDWVPMGDLGCVDVEALRACDPDQLTRMATMAEGVLRRCGVEV